MTFVGIGKKRRNMQPTTLSFPNYQSLCLFTTKTQAVNVHIKPKNSIVSGLFEKQDIDKALKEFQASVVEKKLE